MILVSGANLGEIFPRKALIFLFLNADAARYLWNPRIFRVNLNLVSAVWSIFHQYFLLFAWFFQSLLEVVAERLSLKHDFQISLASTCEEFFLMENFIGTVKRLLTKGHLADVSLKNCFTSTNADLDFLIAFLAMSAFSSRLSIWHLFGQTLSRVIPQSPFGCFLLVSESY